MSLYTRNENESPKEYKLRLCRQKEQYNLSWNAIAEILNEEFDSDYAAGTVRTWFKWYNEGYMDRSKEQAVNDNVLDEFEEKLREIELEKKKKQTVAIEYNKILREEARRQMIVEEIRGSISRVEAPPFTPVTVSERTSNKSYILGISDIHFGKAFTSVNNTYNEEIFYDRMHQLLQEVVQLCYAEHIESLIVLNVGDSVEGMALRVSQIQSLEMGFIDMVIRFSRFMVSWLNELSRYVRIEYHHVPSANHTELRPLGTKAGQFPKEDMERVIQVYIHDMLENNDRITVHTHEQDYARFKIFDFVCYAKHGHQVKNLKTYLRDLSMLHREFVDYLFVGHYHYQYVQTVSEGILSNSQMIMFPSIMGSDEFSDLLVTGSKAGASLLMFEEGVGRKMIYDFILN